MEYGRKIQTWTAPFQNTPVREYGDFWLIYTEVFDQSQLQMLKIFLIEVNIRLYNLFSANLSLSTRKERKKTYSDVLINWENEKKETDKNENKCPWCPYSQ